MLIAISPAKRLTWDQVDVETTVPRLQDQADILAGHARQLSVADLRSLMGLSENLARLNRDRFNEMGKGERRPAAWAFAGDTYQGLEMVTLDAPARAFADDRLRILSGLYGVLRPRDGIEAYRLEMGSKLKTRRGTNLYQFWGERIAHALRADASAVGTDTILNCASQEYFGAVDTGALGLRVVTPRFLDEKNGEPKVVSFHAKRARGAMARFVCEHRITDPDALTSFDSGGYAHAPELSEPDRPAFYRNAALAASA